MKNKKLAILAAFCLVTATATVATGCKKPEPAGPAYGVDITLDTLDMYIGEEKMITSTYEEIDGATLVYTSSDESVATVDATGNITAIRPGTATITATYGDDTDTCVVTVGLGEYAPILKLPNVTDDAMTLKMWTNLDLTGTVVYNEESYDDAEFAYEVSNEAVGAVTHGVFVPAGFGTAEITITATWRGVNAPTLTSSVTVTVEPDWDYTVNGATMTELTLFTEAAEGYAAEAPFVVAATENGAPLTATVEVTKGKGIVTYDATAQKLSTNGVIGDATLTVTVVIQNQTLVKEFYVTVTQTIYERQETVDNFSAIHGDVVIGDNLKTILGGNLVSAYTEDGTPLDVSGNKVYGVESSKDGEFNATITVCSAAKGVKMNIKGYSGIFAKAQDLAALNTNANPKGASGREPVDSSKPMQLFDGYYVLANNIDASEYEHAANGLNLATWGIDNPKNWSIDATGAFGLVGGTFDGQGYTIKGITFNEHGLFGYVSANSTIKNVAFTEVTLNDVNYASVLAAWINDSTISNVYVSVVNDAFTKRGGIFAAGIQNSNISACVIETKSTFESAQNGYNGVLFYQNRDIVGDREHNFVMNEVYVLSKEKLGYSLIKEDVKNEDGTTTEVSTYHNFIAENESAPTDPAADQKYHTLNGVKKYPDRETMAQGTNTFNTFSSSFWTITNGTPVWNTADDTFTPPVEEEEDLSDTVVGDFNPDWVK